MFTVCDEVRSGVLKQEAFQSALDALSGSERVERLLADYDVGELEAGISSVFEHVRSLGLETEALDYVETDLTGPLIRAKVELQPVLAQMLTLGGRGVTEEKNIQQLASLVRALERVDAGDPECGLAVLGATSNFKQNKGCRACAKPLAREAEERAAVLRDAAAGRASDGYAAAFLELLERFSAAYALAKEKLGVLDFEDLQLKARDLLRDRPGLVRHYRSLLSEVMVDEFQDTNELQLSVVSELAGEALATVGDEKQSIYGWRNADVEVFRRRQRDLGDERTYTLPENFRSHPELVALFNELFAAEPFWPAAGMRLEVGASDWGSDSDKIARWPRDVPRVQLTLLDAAECADIGKPAAEAEAVADYFETLRDAGMRQGDFVVLLRAMTRAETFESALRSRGFDVYVASGGSFFDTPEAEEVEALLRTFANTRDDEAFVRLLCGRMASVSDDALYLLRSAAAGSPGAGRRSLWEAAKDPARMALAAVDEVILGRIVEVITDLRNNAGRTSLYDLIHRACERLDYDLTLLAAGQPRAWANVLKFARLADEYERLTPGDPSAFLEHLAQRRSHKRYEQQAAIAAEEVDAVRIMSVHAAKGLEFPVVALPELGNQPPHGVPTFDCGSPNDRLTLAVRLPAGEDYTGCRDTASSVAVREWRAAREREEAKRVFYVACTRATQALAMFSVVDPRTEVPADRPIGWVLRAAGIGIGGSAAETTEDTRATEGGENVNDEDGATFFDAQVGCATMRVKRATPRCGLVLEDVRRSATWAHGIESPANGCDVPEANEPDHLHGRPARISYTGLQTYVDCPYRYYATYVAKVGTLEEIEEPKGARVVGTAVHQALRLAGPDGSPPPDQLKAIGERLGLDDVALERVRCAVRSFLESPLAREVLGASTVLREAPFGVDVNGTTLNGAMDLIALTGRRAHVVDYKTGTAETTPDAIERWRLQSACYVLAVFESMPSVEDAEVVFFKPEAGANEKRFWYGRDELADLRSRIGGIISLIADGSFEPRASYDERTCRECPALGNLCPVQAPWRKAAGGRQRPSMP